MFENKEEITKIFEDIFKNIENEISIETEWNQKINADVEEAKNYASFQIPKHESINEYFSFIDDLFEKYVEAARKYSEIRLDNELEVQNIPLEKNCCKEVEEENNNEEKVNSDI